ncbi:MAG: ATP-binding protein, partial [Gammaproteobacteria bacterium]|nr:ATP-binding protein [Gammaproteobacteria bacterium]
MRISRLTVDKLGVKLYDKVSAVIAELVANSYDADATKVRIHAPMNHYLATKTKQGVKDKGFCICIEDDGHGMTPDEMQKFFLVVGAERRSDAKRGDLSRKYKRKVMGRKGVGKLAPFGICRIIEIISSGGKLITENGQSGYHTSHIVLDYDGITDDQSNLEQNYPPTVGSDDGTLKPSHGTKVILKNFNYRRVPDIETLARQIAQRFGIRSSNWSIELLDNTKTPGDDDHSREVGEFDITYMPDTKISFRNSAGKSEAIGPDGEIIENLSAGFEHDSNFYPLNGWIAYSKQPYKDELMVGVRIYCRGKIAAQTHIFNQKAGFTGEHNIRSYLIGQLSADWLDEEEDLIQTDRRDILWSDELGSAFQEWGQKVVKLVGNMSRDPTRKAAAEIFFETGKVEERVKKAYPSDSDSHIRQQAIQLANRFGRTINRDEAKNLEVVNGLVDLSIQLAPHITLDDKMREAAEREDTPLAMLSAILRTARFAELASFGRIASDRIRVMDRLEELKDNEDTQEDSLQKLIEDAPWLVNPEWAPVTTNQTLRTLRNEFEKFYEKKTGKTISLTDFSTPGKRPDFVLTTQEWEVQIIEIKRPDHKLTNDEMDRIVTYYQQMDGFLADPANEEITKTLNGFHITLVCDGLALSGSQKAAYDGYLNSRGMTRI